MEILLLTAPEVARTLSLGRSKAYELMASGELPVVRIGRCGLTVDARTLGAYKVMAAVLSGGQWCRRENENQPAGDRRLGGRLNSGAEGRHQAALPEAKSAAGRLSR